MAGIAMRYAQLYVSSERLARSSRMIWQVMAAACLLLVAMTGKCQAETDSGNNEALSANLFPEGDFESDLPGAGWKGNGSIYTLDAHGGMASHIISPKGAMSTTTGTIVIDPSKTYRLSYWIRSTNPRKPSICMLFIRFETKEHINIEPDTINPISPIGTLAKEAAKDDRKLLVSAKDWPLQTRLVSIATDVKEDLSDLPNSVALPVTNIENDGDQYTITLKKPLEKSIAAGTTVRLNRYVDYPSLYMTAPSEWTYYETIVHPYAGSGPGMRQSIWPGSHYARLCLIVKDVDEKNTQVLIDDVSLVEVKPGTKAKVTP